MWRTMSEALPGSSSGAAQAPEEGFVAGDDLGDGRGVGSRVPLVELERAAEDDPVGPREHVAGPTGEGVADLALRLENRQLAARRAQVRVAEQFVAAETRAVEHQALGQSGDIGRSGEAPHLELAAGELDVADHLAETAPRLDVH